VRGGDGKKKPKKKGVLGVGPGGRAGRVTGGGCGGGGGGGGGPVGGVFVCGERFLSHRAGGGWAKRGLAF